MNFEFYSAGRIIFGKGVFQKIGILVSNFGKKALVITGKNSFKNSGNFKFLHNELNKNNIEYTLFDEINREPDTETVDKIAEIGFKNHTDTVIGIGGGSVIDTGKAVSGILTNLTNNGSVSDYLEGIGTAEILKPSLPYIAVPTTSGTGAEVTKNAVIYSKEKNVKRSMRSPYLIPDIALADAELTVNLSKEQTSYSGMDALTQLIEAYTSKKAQPMTSALAIYGIKLTGKSLLKSYNDGSDIKAREDMLLASLLSGLALANAGLGAVHGLASSLGAFSIPHGKICAVLLPVIIKENISYNIERFADIGRAVSGRYFSSDKDAAYFIIDYITDLCFKLNIPENLKEYRINRDSISEIVQKAGKGNLKANPKLFTEEELTDLLEKIL